MLSHCYQPLRAAVVIAALFSVTFVQPLATFAQNQGQGQSDLSSLQRLNVMRSKLEAMRRSLTSAIAAMNSSDSGDKQKNPDDPRERLRGLDKEAGALLSDVNDLHAKEDNAEKYDTSRLCGLKASITEW